MRCVCPHGNLSLLNGIPEESSANQPELTPEQQEALFRFEQNIFRQMDLELLENPTLWPNYPYLELHDPNSFDGIYYEGLMVVDEECGEHRTTVFDEVLSSMEGHGGNRTVDDLLLETSCIIYETLGQILQDGWQVS